MSRWRPALRMARRDLRRHRLRALLTCVLVALPVLVATVVALASYNSRWDAERQARDDMALADATVEVTPFSAVRPRSVLEQWHRPAEHRQQDGRRVPVRRDPGEVDLRALLPAGSELVPDVDWTPVPLASGGTGHAVVVSDSPVVGGLLELRSGRLPTAADEVALTEPVASELDLLVEGEPTEDARLQLADGSSVRVTGTVEVADRFSQGAMTIAVPERSDLLDKAPTTRYLVDLPALSGTELEQLVRDAAAAGVALRPRDAVLHPSRWGLDDYSDPVDVDGVVVGAMVVLVGMLEVVLLVGAAFAVAARRQVRDLGLLATNGGAADDVRRVLLAQGLVLGVTSSLVGVAAGVATFRALDPLWDPVLGIEMWRHEIDWLALPVILVLGAATAVVAALLPAWSIARLTPVAALSGRFPVRDTEARAHRGAFVLAAAGLALLALGGWATARTFGPGGSEVAVAPFVAGLGLVLLVAGAVWSTPYVVRRAAGVGRLLPLSGRYAFRDAARHRFRSASAVVALTVTVAGAVLAGFAFSATARSAEGNLPRHAVEVYVDGADDEDRVSRVVETVTEVLGPVEVRRSSRLVGGREREPLLRGGGELRSVDEETLQVLVGDSREVLEAFRNGALVRLHGGAGERATLVVHGAEGRERLVVPSILAPPSPEGRTMTNLLGSAFVSEARADELGLAPGESSLLALAPGPVSQDQLDRLAVHGISAWSEDPNRTTASRLQYAGLGVAALLCVLVVGVAVGLAAAESRQEVTTLSAVGAGPWRRRAFGAVHGAFLGAVSVVLGVVIGLPAGMAFSQVDGVAGIDVPWTASVGTAAAVLLAAPLVGWLVTPTRLRPTRRTA